MAKKKSNTPNRIIRTTDNSEPKIVDHVESPRDTGDVLRARRDDQDDHSRAQQVVEYIGERVRDFARDIAQKNPAVIAAIPDTTDFPTTFTYLAAKKLAKAEQDRGADLGEGSPDDVAELVKATMVSMVGQLKRQQEKTRY